MYNPLQFPGKVWLEFMRIHTKRTLRKFWERHRDAEPALDEWYRTVRRLSWNTPADLLAHYPDARILSNNRAIFRIRGNRYRLVVEIDYANGIVYIRFVGTHARYNRINALEV